MKPTLTSLTLVLTILFSQASAADLWSLLGRGDTTLPGGDVVYTLDNAAGVNVNVALKFGEQINGGYTSVQLTAFKFTGNFTPQELGLFASNVSNISAECFNTDPFRGAAIEAWMLSNDAREKNFFFTAGVRLAEKSFGPLQLALEKRSNGRGHSITVSMSRKGVPGQAPWIKSCFASG